MICPVFTTSAISVYIPIEALLDDFPEAVIVPLLAIVIPAPGSELPFIAASPIPPDDAVVVPLLYSPKSPTAPSPTLRFPVDDRLPLDVDASEPDPVTFILFPRVRFPPLLNIPIPPPDRKLNVRFPVIPRFAVPLST